MRSRLGLELWGRPQNHCGLCQIRSCLDSSSLTGSGPSVLARIAQRDRLPSLLRRMQERHLGVLPSTPLMDPAPSSAPRNARSTRGRRFSDSAASRHSPFASTTAAPLPALPVDNQLAEAQPQWFRGETAHPHPREDRHPLSTLEAVASRFAIARTRWSVRGAPSAPPDPATARSWWWSTCAGSGITCLR